MTVPAERRQHYETRHTPVLFVFVDLTVQSVQ